MKAKTKRRIKHIVTRKKLVKKATSRRVLRSLIIMIATVSTGSLAYAIALNKPVVSVSVKSNSSSIKIDADAGAPSGPVSQSGKGSWYALGLRAPDALTCASRTFPRGTYLEVKNLRNGKTVTCLVNDYGPEAWTGRVIDLSRGSFTQIESLGAGTVNVEIRVVPPPDGAINLPIVRELGTIMGYRLCQQNHDGKYCDLHRQD